jgi:hypothetical protein
MVQNYDPAMDHIKHHFQPTVNCLSIANDATDVSVQSQEFESNDEPSVGGPIRVRLAAKKKKAKKKTVILGGNFMMSLRTGPRSAKVAKKIAKA